MINTMSDRVACLHSSCNSSFSCQQAMEQHYKDSHESPQYKKFPCPQCSRSFHSAAALKDHLVSAHRLDPLVAATTASTAHIVDAPSVLPLDLQLNGVACNDCGKCFDTTDHLHRHQWDSPPTHTRVCDTRKPNFASPVRGCSQCGKKLASSDDLEQHPITEILVLDEDGIWQSIAQHFRQAWKAPTVKLYKVERIFKVYNPGWRRKDFEQYRKEIKQAVTAILTHKQEELDDSLRTKMLHNGNELRRYHGTTVECALGRQPEAVDITPAASAGGHSLCMQTDCGMCRILQTGFKQSKCKVERFQRFGKGIYCSSVSSKASAYVRCSNIDSGAGSSIISYNYFTSILSSFNPFIYFYGLLKGFLKYVFGIFSIGISTSATAASGNYKVIMACKVLAGRPYRSTRNLQHLEGPPPGYQSVQGEPGLHLNYEELVLYDDRAILPDFIILYSSSDS